MTQVSFRAPRAKKPPGTMAQAKLSMAHELARRCGGALGLAYAMHDRGDSRRDVIAQLREARALALTIKEDR